MKEATKYMFSNYRAESLGLPEIKYKLISVPEVRILLLKKLVRLLSKKVKI